MPRYDYRCTLCDYEFELQQSIQSVPGARCPVCEGTSHRIIQPVPFRFGEKKYKNMNAQERKQLDAV